MTNPLRRGWPALIALTAFAPAWSAGPFEIRRTLDGSNLEPSAPVAIVTTAPFDETIERSTNAESYFYGVYDASGNRLAISVHSLRSGAIRVGFDDGNPGSAPVDAASSTVIATPASIRADGVQLTTITIVPRDADGQMLGRGLDVRIDPSLLWPVRPAGDVVDVGDGSYRMDGLATVPGTGIVLAVVEGIALTSSPEVEATALEGSLRDLAILQLRDLASSGGRLDSPETSAARARALEALTTLASDDPARDDNAIKTDIDGAIRELVLLGTAEANALAEDLVEIAAMIALWHVERTRDACGGDCPRAEAALAVAEALHAENGGDWSRMVDAYAWTVEMALQHYHLCTS